MSKATRQDLEWKTRMERPDSMDIKDQNGKTRMERLDSMERPDQWIKDQNGIKARNEARYFHMEASSH